MKFKLSFLISLFISSIHAQYNPKTFNWKNAGFKGPKPVYSQNLNILNFGGDNTNNNSNNLALSNAISALNNQGGTIYFPPGVYKFTASVSISRDSIQLKGAGYDSTQLRFNLNGNIVNCININGSAINSDTTAFLAPGYRDSSKVTVFNPNIFSSGDWVYLQCNDSSYMAST